MQDYEREKIIDILNDIYLDILYTLYDGVNNVLIISNGRIVDVIE